MVGHHVDANMPEDAAFAERQTSLPWSGRWAVLFAQVTNGVGVPQIAEAILASWHVATGQDSPASGAGPG